MKRKTREEWLQACTGELKTRLFKRSKFKCPVVKVSCGFPAKGGLRAKNRTIGQCFATRLSAGKVNEIFIHPALEDSVETSGILLHELIHASDNCKSGHKGHFVKVMKEFGLGGIPTATIVDKGSDLENTLKAIVKKIGKYPHKKLSYGNIKKQSTRLIKVSCDHKLNIDGSGQSEYIARVSRKTLVEQGPPICPVCVHSVEEFADSYMIPEHIRNIII